MHRASAWRRISPLYCEKSQVQRASRGQGEANSEARQEEKRGKRKEAHQWGRVEEWNGFVQVCGIYEMTSQHEEVELFKGKA